MDIRKLQRAIVDGLEDVKGQDIVVFNTEHLSPLFERVIIASGTSNRQTKALASGVRESVRAAGFPVLATEGGDNGEWIIVDCGAAVAHIFQPAIRDYYRLEEIWGGKPVKMKLGERSTGLVKASAPEDDDEVAMAPERKAAAKKVAAKKVATKPAPAKTAAVKVSAKPAAKKVARTAAERSTSDRPAAKKALAEEAAARQAAARKTAAAKKVARPTSVRPASAKQSPARKTAARTVAAAPAETRWDDNPGKTAPRKKAAPLGPVTKTLVVKPVARKTAVAKPAAPAARRKPAAVAGKTAGAARKTPARRG
jgi:ribosome-associated protein